MYQQQTVVPLYEPMSLFFAVQWQKRTGTGNDVTF